MNVSPSDQDVEPCTDGHCCCGAAVCCDCGEPVPMRRTCPECGGTGEDEDDQECVECDGFGTVAE